MYTTLTHFFHTFKENVKIYTVITDHKHRMKEIWHKLSICVMCMGGLSSHARSCVYLSFRFSSMKKKTMKRERERYYILIN